MSGLKKPASMLSFSLIGKAWSLAKCALSAGGAFNHGSKQGKSEPFTISERILDRVNVVLRMGHQTDYISGPITDTGKCRQQIH